MRLVISSQKLIGLSFVEQTSLVKNRFLTLPYRLVKWHAKRSLPVCFLASVLKIFTRSQVTFEMPPKRKNSQYRRLGSVWAQESVESLSQIKRRLVDLPVPFPYAIYSALKIRGIFKYDILSNYAMFDHCCSWCIQKPNINGLNGAALWWDFFLKICSISTASILSTFMLKEARSLKNERIGSLFISGRFETHQSLGWCCVYCEFCSLWKSNLSIF